jgi:hypothetical protein
MPPIVNEMYPGVMAVAVSQVEYRGSGGVRGDRVVTGGQYRRQYRLLPGDWCPGQAVHPWSDQDECPLGDLPTDLSERQTTVEELLLGDEAVLPGRNRRHLWMHDM